MDLGFGLWQSHFVTTASSIKLLKHSSSTIFPYTKECTYCLVLCKVHQCKISQHITSLCCVCTIVLSESSFGQFLRCFPRLAKAEMVAVRGLCNLRTAFLPSLAMMKMLIKIMSMTLMMMATMTMKAMVMLCGYEGCTAQDEQQCLSSSTPPPTSSGGTAAAETARSGKTSSRPLPTSVTPSAQTEAPLTPYSKYHLPLYCPRCPLEQDLAALWTLGFGRVNRAAICYWAPHAHFTQDKTKKRGLFKQSK